jgi:hypothetical protein
MKNRLIKPFSMFLALLLSSFWGHAQTPSALPKLLFEQDSVYIGKVKMPEGALEQSFRFRVLPGQQATIAEVKPDCACSIASFPSGPLAGGDIGEIAVRFSPYKYGPFEKRFAVIFSDEQAEPVELVLKGYLMPESPDVALDFPYQSGNLRLRRKVVSFGGIGHNTLVKQRIEFYNSSDFPVSFLDSMQLPPYIEVALDTPKAVPPQGLLGATVFYHPELKNDFGYSLDNIRLFTDDPAGSLLELEVVAIIRPDKPAKTANSPQLWVGNEEIDLGQVPFVQDYIVSFLLYNRGSDDLAVQQVVTNEQVAMLGLDKVVIPKGQFANLRLQVTGLEAGQGTQYRKVLLYTNDPEQPTKELRIKVTVP